MRDGRSVPGRPRRRVRVLQRGIAADPARQPRDRGGEDLGDGKRLRARAITEAIRLGTIGFDAAKLSALARLERRPACPDLVAYPHLPRRTVRTTVAADQAALVPRVTA